MLVSDVWYQYWYTCLHIELTESQSERLQTDTNGMMTALQEYLLLLELCQACLDACIAAHVPKQLTCGVTGGTATARSRHC